MTIIFGYFHYFPFNMLFINTLQMIISYTIFGLSRNLLILRSSRNLPKEVGKTRILLSAAIINISFSTLSLLLPTMIVSSPTVTEEIIVASYIIFLGLINSLPSFISMGIFFFLFGKTNRERYNVYLMLAGILWMISQGFNVAFLNGNLLNVINLLTYPPIYLTMPFSLLRTLLYLVVWIIGLNGFILLMIHGIKNNDKNLNIAGILGIINVLFLVVYYLFISITPG